MTKTLILMRHAKSSWDDLSLSDHERPLNNRGRRASTALGHWLRELNIQPDQALISSAVRTRETFERAQIDCPPQATERLYHAGPDQMMSVLHNVGAGDTVLIVAHNPGIAGFAEQIVRTPPNHPRFIDFPTAATLVASLDVQNWKNARWNSASVLHFVIPRDLEDKE